MPPLVLDLQMAKQWFAGNDTADQELDRAMVAQLRRDIGPRIAAVRALAVGSEAAQAKAELHKLRGAVSSFGFSASSEFLKQAEYGWETLDPAVRVAKLAAAESSFAAGVVELLKQYPHLS